VADQLTCSPEELLAEVHDLDTPDVIDEPAPAEVGAQPSY
jgi:hypothetical protein